MKILDMDLKMEAVMRRPFFILPNEVVLGIPFCLFQGPEPRERDHGSSSWKFSNKFGLVQTLLYFAASLSCSILSKILVDFHCIEVGHGTQGSVQYS